MLQWLSLEDWELSVLLTNDEFIHELNREHRGKDRPTDVLAFPQHDASGERLDTEEGRSSLHAFPEKLLGDVVLSLDTAQRQAEARNHDLTREATFLLAHGVLHLVGYDHQTDAEEAEMDARTRQLVEACQ